MDSNHHKNSLDQQRPSPHGGQDPQISEASTTNETAVEMLQHRLLSLEKEICELQKTIANKAGQHKRNQARLSEMLVSLQKPEFYHTPVARKLLATQHREKEAFNVELAKEVLSLQRKLEQMQSQKKILKETVSVPGAPLRLLLDTNTGSLRFTRFTDEQRVSKRPRVEPPQFESWSDPSPSST